MTNTTKLPKVQRVQRVQRAAPIARIDDAEEAARHARFGALPQRIRPEDTVEERPATLPDPARNTYSDDDWLIHNVV